MRLAKVWWRKIVTTLCALILVSCAKAEPVAQGSPIINSGRVIQALRRDHSVSCVVDGVKGPQTYLYTDVGKSGVMQLSTERLVLLRRIAHYVTSPSLRFGNVGKEFIVFDASYGPCAGGAPGYWVLNGGCNEYFSPTDDFKSTHGVDNCWGPPRPWIKHDSGMGKQSWANYNAWR